jgi:hypothetical protein
LLRAAWPERRGGIIRPSGADHQAGPTIIAR